MGGVSEGVVNTEVCYYLVEFLMKGQGVVLLVNKFFGPKVNASMSIGNTLSNNCTQLSGSMEGAFWPAIVSAYGKGDAELFRTLALRTSKFAACLILIFAVPLAFEIDEVLLLWLKKPPAYTGGLCICFLIVLVVDKITTGHCTAINAVGRVAVYQAVISAVLLLTVPLGWLGFAAGCDVYAVSYAMIGTAVVATMVRVIFASRIAGLSAVTWGRCTVFPLVVAVVFSGLLAYIPQLFLPPSFYRIVLTTLFFLTGYFPLVYLIVMDRSERRYVWDHLKEKLRTKG